MKYILLVVVLFSSSIYAGVLMQEWTEGVDRFCKYSDGQVIRVNYGSVCPATN